MQVEKLPHHFHLLENRNAEVDTQYFNSHDIVHELTQKMVCKPDPDEEEEAFCVVRDFSGTSQNLKVCLKAPSTMTGKEFVQMVAKLFNFEPCSFRLVSPTPCKKNNSYQAVLTEHSEELLKDVGVNFETNNRNLFIVEGLNSGNPKLLGKEDDLELGASASPEEPSSSTSYSPPLQAIMPAEFDFLKYGKYLAAESSERCEGRRNRAPRTQNFRTRSESDIGYRGLVNQAMTCYLNSLLQALFMTPEFRNALYNWKFVPCAGVDESKSIPYQLQRLFLNLQTSQRRAIETTDLTRSFGWDSSEAWQQHDIQELCRVMFDALEQEFKGTEQADLINRLYEGKMMDYVKCLECGTEKCREDTFLDIPLPVRPFGSSIAYGSVEEALRAFVQPEVLDGNNQYFCEKCNKKCNAHKGLKFVKFPYLLTLHLLRFDFDYNTMHRIKLGDKVVFPETLNLNGFVPPANLSTTNLFKEEGSEGFPEEITGSSSKCDDSSTTDSGSAIDDESCMTSSNDLNNVDYDQDIDEGIDVSNQHENEKNRSLGLEFGPYVYELFTIMVHSGSASGGHYYVYIKDFSTGDWFCFNDQTVTRITNEDIDRSFGGYGGPSRGYYSGVYSSSMNAYMLMYRRIDRERNVLPLREDEFPPHIKTLLKEIDEKAETERRMRELERETYKIRVFVNQPYLNKIIDTKVECKSSTSLKEVTQIAYNKLQLGCVVPIDLCRLVLYNSQSDAVENSLEGKESEKLSSLLSAPSPLQKTEMLLEIRKPDERFAVYRKEAVPVKLYLVDLETGMVHDTVTMRISLSSLVSTFRDDLYEKFKYSRSHLLLVFLGLEFAVGKFLEDETVELLYAGVAANSRIFIVFTKSENSVTYCRQKMRKVVSQYLNTIKLSIVLPESKPEFSKDLSLPAICKDNHKNNSSKENLGNVLTEDVTPSAEKRDDVNAVISDNGGTDIPITNGATSKLLAVDTSFGINDDFSNVAALSSTSESSRSDQSASEDNSLTDSDRTIVGENVEDYQMSSPSSSPPRGYDVRCNFKSSHEVFNLDEVCKEILELTEDFDTEENCSNTAPCDYYFKELSNNAVVDRSGIFSDLKIEVDKRIPMAQLKRLLEPYVQVPSLHFNLINRNADKPEGNWLPPVSLSSLENVSDESTLQVQLVSLPKHGSLKGNLYLLDFSLATVFRFVAETFIEPNMTVSETKNKFLNDVMMRLRIAENEKTPPETSYQLRAKILNHAPGKIYSENSTWKELNLEDNWEMYIQRLRYEEAITDPSTQICLTVRRYRPSNKKAHEVRELVVSEPSLDLVKQKISEISQIPVEKIVLGEESWASAINHEYESYSASVWDPDSEVDWNVLDGSTSASKWLKTRAEGGFIIYYKDERKTHYHYRRVRCEKNLIIRVNNTKPVTTTDDNILNGQQESRPIDNE